MTETYLRRGSSAAPRERISDISTLSASDIARVGEAFRKARDAAERHTPFGVLDKTQRDAVVGCAARDTGVTPEVAFEAAVKAGQMRWAV